MAKKSWGTWNGPPSQRKHFEASLLRFVPAVPKRKFARTLPPDFIQSCSTSDAAMGEARGSLAMASLMPEPRRPSMPQPMAPSFACAGGTIRTTILPPPPVNLESTSCALAMCGAPIESGERCHICDKPASVHRYYIAWCKFCAASSIAQRFDIMMLGPSPKTRLTLHGAMHAHRWMRMYLKARMRACMLEC